MDISSLEIRGKCLQLNLALLRPKLLLLLKFLARISVLTSNLSPRQFLIGEIGVRQRW